MEMRFAECETAESALVMWPGVTGEVDSDTAACDQKSVNTNE